MKTHLRRVVSTVLTQIESCLNSCPLAPLQCDEDGIEALTPGHFLIGKPLESIPDPAFSYRTLSLLRSFVHVAVVTVLKNALGPFLCSCTCTSDSSFSLSLPPVLVPPVHGTF